MTAHTVLVTDVIIEPCAEGHVHFCLVDASNDGLPCMEGVFTPREAFELARMLMMAARDADNTLREAGGIRDVGPCTLH